MWMRWNDTSHIFEQSFNDGASWAVLPLNASVINEGAINIARLPPNVAYNNLNNNFTVNQTTVGLAVTGPYSVLSITDTLGVVNSRLWRFVQYNDGKLNLEALDDNQTAVQGTVLKCSRNGAVAIGGGLTITAGGLTVTAGGLAVQAGGALVVGGFEMTGLLQIGSIGGPSASFPAWRNTAARMECVLGDNSNWAALAGNSFYSYGAGNNFGDLTVRGGTNFQGGVNITAGGLVVTGPVNTTANIQCQGLVYPGNVVNGASQASWYLGSHSSYGLYTNSGLYVAGSIWSAANLYSAGYHFEHSRAKGMGDWLDFVPSIYGANVITTYSCRYTMVGRTMFIMLYLSVTFTQGPPVVLYLPEGKTCSGFSGNVYLLDNGPPGMLQGTEGLNYIQFYANINGAAVPIGGHVISGTIVVPCND